MASNVTNQSRNVLRKKFMVKKEGYEDAGDFIMTERLKTSIHVNLVFYLIVGSIGLFGQILLISMRGIWTGGVLGFAMASSNTFGLVTGAFLLGFGSSEIPRSLWKNADWTFKQMLLSHKIAKIALKLDQAHQNFSNAIVVRNPSYKDEDHPVCSANWVILWVVFQPSMAILFPE